MEQVVITRVVSQPVVIFRTTQTMSISRIDKTIAIISRGNNSVGIEYSQTTDDSWHTIKTISTTTGKSYYINAFIIGSRSGFSASGSIEINAVNNAGTVSELPLGNVVDVKSNLPANNPNVQVIFSGANILVQVNGGSNDTVNWGLRNPIILEL